MGLEHDQRLPSEFVPFAEQPGSQKRHVIEIKGVVFPAYDIPPNLECGRCKDPLELVVEDYSVSWGDEQVSLDCVVPETPLIHCQCGRSVDDRIALSIDEKTRPILLAIEANDDLQFQSLEGILPQDDVRKVREFASWAWQEPELNQTDHPN